MIEHTPIVSYGGGAGGGGRRGGGAKPGGGFPAKGMSDRTGKFTAEGLGALASKAEQRAAIGSDDGARSTGAEGRRVITWTGGKTAKQAVEEALAGTGISLTRRIGGGPPGSRETGTYGLSFGGSQRAAVRLNSSGFLPGGKVGPRLKAGERKIEFGPVSGVL